jgi:hypothetical protein
VGRALSASRSSAERLAALILAGLALAIAAAGCGDEPDSVPVPVVRESDAEGPAPSGFDQLSVFDGECCEAVTSDERSYDGRSALRTRIGSAFGDAYARGVLELDPAYGAGDELWIGAALYIPEGFYDAKREYVDLMRLDSYVAPEGAGRQQYLALAAYSDDSLDVVLGGREGDGAQELVSDISPERIPEGRWSWVEIHVQLQPGDGAFTELRVDGELVGESDEPNLLEGGAPFDRARFGLVATTAGEQGPLEIWVDRASIGPSSLPPLEAPAG